MLKSRIFFSTLLSLTLLTLAGCNLPTPKDKNALKALGDVTPSTPATFQIQSMAERSKTVETKLQGAFALPTSKIFNLQACVKDVAYDRAILGHNFQVVETNQVITSDKNGCITWSEDIKFNFLAESRYIRIERTVKGLGLHRGTRKVAFAINPWSHGENLTPVLNPDDGNNIPHLISDLTLGQLALRGLTENNEVNTRRLWIDDGRLFVTENKLTKSGVELTVEMRPNTSIQLSKMNGELFLRPLTQGSFKARLKMIHIYQKEGKEIRRLLSQTDVIDVKMENGSLAVKSAIALPAIPTRGQMMLGLELRPINGPEGLLGFDGIYLIGEYDQIKGASFMKLSTVVTQEKDFALAKFINAESTELSFDEKSGAFDQETYQKPKIEVSQLEFRFLRVGKESTSAREVYYNIKACVRSGLDQKNTRAHTFKVTKFHQSEKEDLKTVLVKTDNNSCINWDEMIAFKYFECQHFIRGQVMISNEDLGMNEKLEIIVNPWESLRGIARDMRYVDPSEKLALDCQAESRPRSQFFADYYAYNTLSYSYQMDEFLNLTVSKRIQFKMDPRVLTYSSLTNGRADGERLRDGIYLLRFLVVRNQDYDSKNTYVTSTEKLITVLSGQVNTDLTLQVQDLKALGNRNTLMIQILPVDESKVLTENGRLALKNSKDTLESIIDHNSGLETPVFMGPIIMNLDESTRSLRMADNTSVSQFLIDGLGHNIARGKDVIGQIVAQGRKMQGESAKRFRARTKAQTFAQENNLHLLRLNKLDAKAPLKDLSSDKLDDALVVSKIELQSIVNQGRITPRIAQKLCAFWNNEFLPTIHAEKGGALAPDIANRFGLDCFHSAKNDPSKFFQWEKRLLIKEMGPSEYIKGFNHGMTVGTNFSLSTTNSFSSAAFISAKAGLSKKFLDVFSISGDVGYNLNWVDANGTQNGISVATSTTMTVQQNVFKFTAQKYEQCLIVRLNPQLFRKGTGWKNTGWFTGKDYLSVINGRLSDDEKAQAMTRGLMICEGENRQKSLELTENFYLIAQESNSTQMQDNGDARNRNFFIALRSSNDYNRFVVGIKGKTPMPETYKQELNMQDAATIDMDSLFKMAAPSYPGMYLVK